MKKKLLIVGLILLASVFVGAIGTSRLVQYYVNSTYGGGDKGTLMLGVRVDGHRTLASADGEYTPPQFGEHGGMYVKTDQMHIDLDGLDALTPAWTKSTDAKTLILSATSEHVASHEAATSVSLEKDGATVTEASYGKAITGINGSALPGAGLVDFYVKHATFTNVGKVFVRLGTDASNYNQYGVDPDELSTSLWNHLSFSLHSGVQTGTGLDLSDITYVAFGVIMDASGNTVADVLFNDLEIHSVNATELTITGNAANTVRVQKFGSPSNATVTTNSGNKSSGTQRVVLATDDIPTALTNTSIGPTSAAAATAGSVGSMSAKLRLMTTQLGTIAGAIDGTEMQVDVVTGGSSEGGDPREAVDASGALLDCDLSASKNTSTTGLTPGTTYAITSVDGVVLVGVDDLGAGGTASSGTLVLWVVTAGDTRFVKMPTSETELYYTALTEDVSAYFSEMN